jgi:polysaccharide biosynthesis protein PslG
VRLRSFLDHLARLPRLAAVAGVGTVVSVSLVVPAAAAGANSFGQEMFGIAAGGTIQNDDPATMARDLDAVQSVGSRWVRIDINWAQIQAQGPSSYNWEPIDRVVRAATERGMKVLGIIVYSPSWARPPGTGASHGPDPGKYAQFAATAVEHYAAMGVHAYEVWNEPNLERFWAPPDPAAYTQLLRAAYPAIKGADPQATVLTAGTAPAVTNGTNYSPVDFLAGIYANGGAGSFDAVSHHPYTWPALPGEAESWSAWHQMYGTNPSLRSVMSANGDGEKKIWGTEWGAPTNGPAGAFVSEATQAEMVTKAYSLWRTYEWAGPLFTYQGRDRGTSTDTRENFFGLRRYDNSKKPAYTAYRGAVDNPNTEPPEDPEPGEDPGPGGETGGDPETGDSGGTSDPDDTGGSIPTETTVKGKGYGKGGKKGAGAAAGKVSTTGVSANSREAELDGEVEVTLYRKSRSGWRPLSRPRTTTVSAEGRFRRSLRSIGRRLRPGAFRVHARYLGAGGAMPSASRSRKFKLR